MRELLSVQTSGRAADLMGNYVEVARRCRDDRPWVLLNFVASPDGSVATGGRVGGLSSPVDKEIFRLLRSLGDVILVGAGTVRAEGYGPHRPSAAHQAARRDRGQPPSATMAVVSASLRLDLQSPLFSGGTRPIVIAPRDAEATARAQTALVADLVTAGAGVVDLGEALRQLRSRGVDLVVCEGGPQLFAELLIAGLVDELCLTVSPMLVADPVRLLPSGALTGPTALRLAHVLEDDGHLFLRYLFEPERGDR